MASQKKGPMWSMQSGFDCFACDRLEEAPKSLYVLTPSAALRRRLCSALKTRVRRVLHSRGGEGRYKPKNMPERKKCKQTVDGRAKNKTHGVCVFFHRLQRSAHDAHKHPVVNGRFTCLPSPRGSLPQGRAPAIGISSRRKLFPSKS